MNQAGNTLQDFLTLIRLGIGHKGLIYPKVYDWNAIHELSTRHGLDAVIIDGIEQLPNRFRPNADLLIEWIGEVLRDYEFRYGSYKKAISDLAGFYNAHGYKMMVLKGYACSLDWPKPAHRPCGDIDIWQFGAYKETENLLKTENAISVKRDQHHHTIFDWAGFIVENHYDFINVHSHKSSKTLEKIFKELGKDDSHFIDVEGERVYVPSPDLHALFLLRHAASHFAAEGITLRQLLDWAFFIEKHSKEVRWEWLMQIIDEYHMCDFFNCINAICVEDLGFNSSIFPFGQYVLGLKEKILDDILSSKFQHEPPSQLFPRLKFKYRRWKANEWKRKLCYNENSFSIFFSGIMAHLIKPKTI